MKIGIVGATGLVGEELVNLLKEDNYSDITFFKRSDTFDRFKKTCPSCNKI
jgi:aspartate-semialdehyde dehydrogenase